MFIIPFSSYRQSYLDSSLECTVDVELVATIDEITFVGGRNSSYNQYPNNFSQGQGFRQNEGMYRPQPMQNQRPVQRTQKTSLHR